jgi:hypothetical protein
MFVPMWIVLAAVAAVAVPLLPWVLMLLFAQFVHVMQALYPPEPGSILDPAGERLARGTPRHEWYATPYLTPEQRQLAREGRL